MPPKRKRADTSAVAPVAATPSASTRTTRTSTRATKASASKNATESVAASTVADVTSDTKDNAAAQPTKKSKVTTAKPKAAKSSGKKAATKARDDNSFPSKAHSNTAVTKATAPKHDSDPIKNSSLSDLTKTQPLSSRKSYDRYSSARAVALFETYADTDEPNVMGPEGFTQLCADAQMPMDGALPLVLAWQLQAKEMGKFTRDEWMSGMGTLQISSLSQLTLAVTDLEILLVRGGEPLKRSSSPTKKRGGGLDEPYDRSTYWTYAADRKKAFSKLYTFCFALAKPEQTRNIDMETATAFWSVLLMPQYSIMGEVIEFINEKGTYKGANKDLWGMMLEFCQTVKPSLEDYEADGAWPTLLDDFAIWKKNKSGDGQKSLPAEPDE